MSTTLICYIKDIFSNNVKLYLIKLLVLSIVIFVTGNSFSYANENKDIDNVKIEAVNAVKKAVVKIKTDIRKSAYYLEGITTYGTGFIIDKTKGIILTNKHISNRNQLEDVEVTFYDGREAKAKLLYDDPWLDFAFIKVENLEDIPEEALEIKIAKQEIKNEQPVFMVGSNDGQEFSVQNGLVTGKYQSSGFFPVQSIRVSLNNKGGSSGSPIANAKGEATGIIFSGDDTFAFGIPINYAIDALKQLNQGITPKRYDTGLMLDYFSLDQAVKFLNFPRDQIDAYIKKFPDSRNNALIVESVIEGSPAEKVFEVGDIIWKVEGNFIGPKLYEMQSIINNSGNKEIKFEVYRKGKLIELQTLLYNLNDKVIKKMVLFGGAMFYEADDLIRVLTGAKQGEVFVNNVELGSSFDNKLPCIPVGDRDKICYINIDSIGDFKINNLDDLIKAIPHLVKQSNFMVKYRNFGVIRTYDRAFLVNRAPQLSGIKYYSYGNNPITLDYSEPLKSWQITPILETQNN